MATARAGTTATPINEEYKRHFPVGCYMQPGAVNYRNRDSTTSTTAATFNDTTGLSWAMNHPEQGLRERGIPYVMYGFCVPAVMEDTQAFSAALETDTGSGRVRTVLAPTGRTSADPNTGINYEWFQTAGTTDPTDYTTARSIADGIATNYTDHESNLAYMIKDDVSSAQNQPTATLTMCRAMQDADSYGRPCTFVHVNPELGNLWSSAGADLKIALTYRYPCGEYSDGTDTAEGDFHRSTFSAVADLGGGGGDWVDALREWFAYVPSGIPVWLFLQTHQTVSGGAGTLLRYPSAAELRKQFWIAIGEGVKGIWWFVFDTNSGVWVGFGDATQQALYEVIHELSVRLRPDIRATLLRCERVADAFTASGGGATFPAPATLSYSNAYISTLQDQGDSTYYCVVCNHDDAPANVTITSGSLSGGKLVNLEDGSVIYLGDTISLPALDGTIYRYDPIVGVPEWDPDYRVDVETWWGTHWANSSASAYIAPAAINLYANVVTVGVGENLQSAIDAAPDGTTFSLADGYTTTEEVVIVGRSRLAFVSANPASRATVRSFYVYGSTYAQQYNGTSIPYGFPAELNTVRTAQAVYDWHNPKAGFIFRDLDFDGTDVLIGYPWFLIDGTQQHDHITNHQPIFLRNVRDVLIENCTFSGYEAADDTSAPPASQTLTKTGSPSTWHIALIGGNSGITNVVIRNSTFNVPTDTRGMPHVWFFDGPRGVVMVGNTVGPATGKVQRSYALFLTNDDYTGDFDRDGMLVINAEERNVRYCVWAGNVYNAQCQPAAWTIHGQDNLVVGETINSGTTTTMSIIADADLKCSRWWNLLHHLYRNYRNVYDNITVNKNVTTFLQYSPDNGYNCSGSSDPTNPWRSRIGYSTVKNCTVTGTVTNWILDKAGSTTSSDGGDVESGNSP